MYFYVLKGQCHEIFDVRVVRVFMNHLPPAPDNPSISIFCLQKFAKIFAVKSAPLGLLKLAANLPPVLTAPVVTSF